MKNKNAEKKEKKSLLKKLFNHKTGASFGYRLFYGLTVAALAIAALSIIVIPIIFVVNVAPQDMILPPHVTRVSDPSYTDAAPWSGYKMSFVGFSIVVPDSGVSLSDIKTALYGYALYLFSKALSAAAICFLLARLFRNIRDNGMMHEKNADCVSYLGTALVASGALCGIMERLSFYLTAKALALSLDTGFVFGVDYSVMLLGVVFLFLGRMYGISCRRTAALCTDITAPSDPEGDEVHPE